jgi:hypothetical protein
VDVAALLAASRKAHTEHEERAAVAALVAAVVGKARDKGESGGRTTT